MTKDKALKRALKELFAVLESINAGLVHFDGDDFHETLKIIKESLAQPAQEPVASITKEARGTLILHSGWDDLPNGTKFYTTPPKRPWVGLTEAEIDEWTPEIHGVIRLIDAQLKEKNT